jgi:hypothetical protein
MNRADARKLVAAYVAGEYVERGELEDAQASLRSERSYGEYLDSGATGWDVYVSLCDVFAERAGEFCAMSESERRRDVPLLWRHVRECRNCGHLFWEMTPLWSWGAASLGGHAGALRRVLSQPIRLFNAAGQYLVDRGLNPPELELRAVAATAATPATARRQGKAWALPDDESGYAVQFEIEPASGDSAILRCRLEALDSGAPVVPARIAVRSGVNAVLLLSGDLADFEFEPIVLPGGAWVIALRAGAGGGEYEWEIPIEIAAGGDQPQE